MFNTFKVLGLALLLAIATAFSAEAAKHKIPTPTETMPMGKVIQSPTAFKDFCKRNVGECAVSKPTAFTLNDDNAKALAKSLKKTQKLIVPQVEASGDFWQTREKRGYGDCEDFALTLRKMMRAQFPEASSAFRIATAFTETGEYHAVLSVETNKGTLICDIRFQRCQDWAKMPYTWKFRETAGALVWQRIAS